MFVESRLGVIIETYLLVGDDNEQRKSERIHELEATTQAVEESPARTHAQSVTQMMNYIPQRRLYRDNFSISSVVNKVELASLLSA